MKSIRQLITPQQKVFIKRAIHSIHRLAKNQRKIQTKYEYEIIKEKSCDVFFGYYDVTPFNEQNIIYNVLADDDNSIRIVLQSLEDKSKRIIGHSKAWNWQQGTRLRWFSINEVSFNDYKDGRYYNRIVNVNDLSERVVDWPLYDINYDRSLGLTLNFSRLGVLRPGYGYTCDKYEPRNLDKESIDIIDLKSNKIIKSITYVEIQKALNSVTSFENCYLNHLSFSPDGTKFLFFWIEIIGGYHKASLAVYDISKSEIIPLETCEKVSHYVWKDNDTILCTSYSTPSMCYYYLYKINKLKKVPFCPNSLDVDGHPSYYDDFTIITDTYPDKYGYQHLSFVNVRDDTKFPILDVYSIPVSNGERRTDLHPRLDVEHHHVAVDVNLTGHRSILIVKNI